MARNTQRGTGAPPDQRCHHPPAWLSPPNGGAPLTHNEHQEVEPPMGVPNEVLQRLLEKLGETRNVREQAIEKRKAIVEVAKNEKRDGASLTEDEDVEFRALTGRIKELDGEISALDERMAELGDEEKR